MLPPRVMAKGDEEAFRMQTVSLARVFKRSWIEMAEALSTVLSDTAVRARLTEDGRRRAARYRWNRTAQETLAVYEKVAP